MSVSSTLTSGLIALVLRSYYAPETRINDHAAAVERARLSNGSNCST
jgi:hypothetical protein